MINEFEYCPRLFYLEWVQSRFEHNRDTMEGIYVHRAVDAGGGRMGEAGDPPFRKARSVELSSRRLGLIAKADTIEQKDGKVVPVEVKRGRPPAHGPAWMPEKVQLCTIVGGSVRGNGRRGGHRDRPGPATRDRPLAPRWRALQFGGAARLAAARRRDRARHRRRA